MTQAAFPKESRIPPIGGTALVLIGCLQFASSAVAISSALGMSVFHVFVTLCRALIGAAVGAPEGFAETDIGLKFIDSALEIGQLGISLSLFAVAAGILLLRNKRAALIVTLIFVLHTFVLAYVHFSISYPMAATTYLALGLLFSGTLLLRAKIPARLTDDSVAATPSQATSP